MASWPAVLRKAYDCEEHLEEAIDFIRNSDFLTTFRRPTSLGDSSNFPTCNLIPLEEAKEAWGSALLATLRKAETTCKRSPRGGGRCLCKIFHDKHKAFAEQKTTTLGKLSYYVMQTIVSSIGLSSNRQGLNSFLTPAKLYLKNSPSVEYYPEAQMEYQQATQVPQASIYRDQVFTAAVSASEAGAVVGWNQPSPIAVVAGNQAAAAAAACAAACAAAAASTAAAYAPASLPDFDAIFPDDGNNIFPDIDMTSLGDFELEFDYHEFEMR